MDCCGAVLLLIWMESCVESDSSDSLSICEAVNEKKMRETKISSYA